MEQLSLCWFGLVGVNLAAEPARTAAVVLRWDDNKAVGEDLRVV